MYRNKTITLCLPCRNEGKHLEKVIAKVPKIVDEVIIISNKSTDNTVERARELGLTVYEDNRSIGGIGYGFAHITGISHATGDIIIGADGDGTYPVSKIEKLVDYFLDNKLNFLSCNRYPMHNESHRIPLRLRLGVRFLNLEARLLYGEKIKDILSGMWLIDKNVRDELSLTMGDWNLSPEIKLNAAINPAIKFGERHIVQYQRHGSSHQNYFKTGFSHAWWLLKNRFTYKQREVVMPTIFTTSKEAD